MFFTVTSTSPNIDLAIYRAKKQARLKLATASFGTTELLLSRYLQENYATTLRTACLNIINNAKFNLNMRNEIIITIPDKQLNHIARIITYGTGTFMGSKLLRNIFTI